MNRLDCRGFTLIELMVVIALLSVISLVTVPRLSRFFSSGIDNMALLTKMIAKTHDDSFLNNKTNFLTVHLFARDTEYRDRDNEIFSRANGISVLNMEESSFVENTRKVLSYHEFPDSFRIEEVILRTGAKIRKGNAVIPFYPQGYSDNAILHILINNNDKWTVRIHKHFREPEVIRGYADF